jgi:hypothetical protein
LAPIAQRESFSILGDKFERPRNVPIRYGNQPLNPGSFAVGLVSLIVGPPDNFLISLQAKVATKQL